MQLTLVARSAEVHAWCFIGAFNLLHTLALS